MPDSEQEQHSKYQQAYQAYLGLPSESYEFIARTISIHRWLKQAFETYQHNPGLSAEETYESWHSVFDQVYNNLFAMFLRPYRVMMSPMELVRQPLEMVTPRTVAESYTDWLKLWGDTQARFLKATAEAFHRLGGGPDTLEGSADTDVTGRLGDITPLSLLSHLADEGAEAYFATIDQLAKYLGEAQFMLPKAFFVNLREIASGYPRARHLGEKYEQMFHNAWEQALRRFAGEVGKSDKPLDFKEFFKAYVSVFSSEYNRLMGSPEFIEVQNAFASVTTSTISAMRRFMESQLDLFPFLPFTTRSESDAIEARMHSYKRRIDSLERKVRQMDRALRAQQAATAAAISAPAPAGRRRRSSQAGGIEVTR